MYAVAWVCGEVSTTMKYWLEIQPSAECCWKPICSFSLRKCVGESACRRPIGTECTLLESLHHQSYMRQLNKKPFCGWYDFGPLKKACLRSTLQKALFAIKGVIISLYFCKILRIMYNTDLKKGSLKVIWKLAELLCKRQSFFQDVLNHTVRW